MAKTAPRNDWQKRVKEVEALCQADGGDIEAGIIDFNRELEKPTVRFIGYGCEVPEHAKQRAIELLPDFDVTFDAID